MKLIIMAAALTLGGAAAAQTTEPQTGGVFDTVGRAAVCAGVTLVPASNVNPKRDARGFVVKSDDAQAPDCYNGGVRQVAAGETFTVPTPQPTAKPSLPPCTATLTDGCTQTYERGRRR